ncbi:hypothetical protein NDU88_004130 [Pleurodeles waltl]|uniref:Uncharacterized protein n=1 Tax=Pleurodeles waltl TaxID=8319 RepID=A0AAV7T8Q2_PLEWA|nr:hypothetical protein NDU88_004130 [Pleurodeles waltl]
MTKSPLPNPDQAQKKKDGSKNHSDPAPTWTPTARSSDSAGTQVMGPSGQGIVSASADAVMAMAPQI